MSMISVIVILALLATIASLGWGIGSMAHGGEYDDKHSDHFMSARLVFQGLAIIFLLVAIVLSMG